MHLPLPLFCAIHIRLGLLLVQALVWSGLLQPQGHPLNVANTSHHLLSGGGAQGGQLGVSQGMLALGTT